VFVLHRRETGQGRERRAADGLALRRRVGVAEAISKLVQVERNRESLSMGKHADFTCRQGCLGEVLGNLRL
jgi:hypothetical protein